MGKNANSKIRTGIYTDRGDFKGRKYIVPNKTGFTRGVCAVCAERGIVGYVCNRYKCRPKFFYDDRNGLVRLKPRAKVSKAQLQIFLDVRKWCRGLEVFQEVVFDKINHSHPLQKFHYYQNFEKHLVQLR